VINKIKVSEHFYLSEFQSRDTKEVKIHPDLIVKLEELRKLVCDHFGRDVPLIINSGYRTPEHNKAVGGAENSQHLYGTAVDVRVPKGLTVEAFAAMAESVGFDGIGLYHGRIHVDVRGYKARWDNR
jgi:uncharacterized protein YcbK (DUF882 family)